MSAKKATNRLITQIDDAKKSVDQWPAWMQRLAYFSTTSTVTLSGALSAEKKPGTAAAKKSK